MGFPEMSDALIERFHRLGREIATAHKMLCDGDGDPSIARAVAGACRDAATLFDRMADAMEDEDVQGR